MRLQKEWYCLQVSDSHRPLDSSLIDRRQRKERRLRQWVYVTERVVPYFLLITTIITLMFVIKYS